MNQKWKDFCDRVSRSPGTRPFIPGLKAPGLSGRRFGSVICAIPAVCTVAGFAGRYSWWLDAAGQFRAQYGVVLAVGVVAFLAMRRWGSAGVGATLAVVNLAMLTPFYLGKQSEDPSQVPAFRVVLLNVRTESRAYERVSRFLRDTSPTVVLLEEVDDEWMEHLAPLLPCWKIETRSDNFGIALGSRVPLERAEIVDLGPAGVPSVVGYIKVGAQQVTLVGAHPLAPAGQRNWRQRNEQLARLTEFLTPLERPLVLVGDLNATSWSPFFTDLMKRTGLRDTRLGRGLQSSWPVPLPLLRVPIDHCLVSSDLAVLSRRLGPDVGSDHFPVMVDLAFQISAKSSRNR
jgi:endonuclease/exonuclease/phosphatase (EEP) superfamily protein YafD